MKKGVTLRTKLVLCFTVTICIVIASAYITAGHLETSFYKLRIDNIAHGIDNGGLETTSQYFILTRYKSQIAITALVLTLVLVGIGLYADRLIVQRIIETTAVADTISQGQFDHTVPLTNNDEIGLLGQKINDMAMNSQECLMYMWNMSNHMIALVQKVSEGGKSDGQASHCIDAGQLEKINEALYEMRSTVQSFGLFGVTIDDNRLLAAEVPADCKQENQKEQDHMLDGSFPLQRKVGSFPG